MAFVPGKLGVVFNFKGKIFDWSTTKADITGTIHIRFRAVLF